VQKAKGNVEVIARAIEIQREVIQRISGELAGELETVLRPARSVIVQRIANGFREACEATEELELIEQAVQRETLGRGLMPLKFHAVQTIYDRSQHPFVNWLTERRRDGFAV